MLGIVVRESSGSWMPSRTIYYRAVAELPTNAFVLYMSEKPARRAKMSAPVDSVIYGFPMVQREKAGSGQSLQVRFRAVAPMAWNIVTGRGAMRGGFVAWRRAMTHGSHWESSWWSTPEGALVGTMGGWSKRLEERVSVGFDETGRDWTVQINQPSRPGTHDVMWTIAVDPTGRRALLRQGTLQANRQSEGRITGAELQRRTGLKPLDVNLAGRSSSRI